MRKSYEIYEKREKYPLRSLICGLLLMAAGPIRADIVINGPTTDWVPILYGINYPDYADDQQTGDHEADLVGDMDNPSFYTQFDDAGTTNKTDGTLAFRIRLGAGGKKTELTSVIFIGIDGDSNGSIDLFVGYHDSGNKYELAIWNPGTDLNISPNTTSIESPPILTYLINPPTVTNLSWESVSLINDPTATTLDVDSDTSNDWFLSFSLPFNDIYTRMLNNSITIDEDSALSYVVATAQNDNALNQDLNGIPKTYDGTLTWGELGGLTAPYSATGLAIPEAATGILCFTGSGILIIYRKFFKIA